jgi:hypothetical protein
MSERPRATEGQDMKNNPAASRKQGALSTTQHSPFIAQEVQTRTSRKTVLEIQRTTGEVLHAVSFDDLSSGFQISPDGAWVYSLCPCPEKPNAAGAPKRLVGLDVNNGVSHELGVVTGARPAVDETHVAYFADNALVVRRRDGTLVLEKPLGALGVLHGGAAHACAFLPDGRIAVSRGARLRENIADLSVFDIDSGQNVCSFELPVTTHTTFSPAAVRGDPNGRLVAILGHYDALVIVDLATGENVADRFAPEPLDLAEGRATQHFNHTYSDLAFDARGEKMAAVHRPGKLSVWTRDGRVLRREAIAINPKAQRVVTFDGDTVAFFDSMGERAIFPATAES